MPGSRVNLGMGQPGRKAAKGKAVKKAKGGSMMKPPGMKAGGRVDKEDPTLPKGKYARGGLVGFEDAKEKSQKKIVPDESGGRKLKPPPNKGAAKLPKEVRNRMGFMQDGGPVKKSKGGPMRKMAKGGPMKKMAKGGSMYKKGKKSGPKP